MSAIPRPPSRSERLLRDTLRKDDTLRSHAHSARPRSASSTRSGDGDDDDDDDLQSAILFRHSSRRCSAASVLAHHPTTFYVPDQNEQASYSCLLRSSSHSGSSRSGCSECKSSPRPAYTHEKHEDGSRHHDAAPHEAVLRSRLDTVFHSMRIDGEVDAPDLLTHAQSNTASLPSSFGSSSNSRTHSHESHQTHLTHPDPDPCAPLPERPLPWGHRQTHSASVGLPSSNPISTPPRVSARPPQSPRSPHTLRSPPRTPTSSQEKDQLRRLHPDSPWMYMPLPPSPPAYSTSPSKCSTSPAVVTFVASPPLVDTHLPSRSPHSAFDPDAASHALKQRPGYVSFASVAGLGAPPEEEDRRSGRKPFTGFGLGGRGRLSGLGLGSGKWWMF